MRIALEGSPLVLRTTSSSGSADMRAHHGISLADWWTHSATQWSEELAEFGEQVYVKDPISRHAKLDDRWIGPVTWIGKADRGDQHMIVSTNGRAVELHRSIRRIPLSHRWKAEGVTRIKVSPWHPKTTELGELKPRRRYITWAMLQQFGASPNCRTCAGDGGAHSESCRLQFEKIWDKEEARALRALAGELGRPSGEVGAAEADAQHAHLQ